MTIRDIFINAGIMIEQTEMIARVLSCKMKSQNIILNSCQEIYVLLQV